MRLSREKRGIEMYGKGIMIAAGASGSGKTAVTCGILSALKQRGLFPAACKCGPDYIDPMFHREVLGIPSENLDLFFCERTALQELFVRHTEQADFVVTEGVMGYYDGLSLETDTASSYEVACVLDLPVILVISCRGMALSVVPAVLGMLEFRRDHHICGILLNRISGMLYPRMKQMIETELKKRGYAISVVGYVPEDEVFHIESRHLGLVLPGEIQEIRSRLERAGEILEETVNLDLLLEIAGTGSFVEKEKKRSVQRRNIEYPVKIGVAQDEAFCFYYQDNLELLKKLGCELVFFSPLHDTDLPKEISGVLLGGGYPEQNAKALSENKSMRESVCKAVWNGLPCIAECGGFLYLQEMLEGIEGEYWPMAGVFSGKAYRTEKMRRFGYLCLRTEKENGFLKPGEEIRGHEFHYWDCTENGTDCLAVKPDGRRSWKCAYMNETIYAGFPHLYFRSNMRFIQRFVEKVYSFRTINFPFSTSL